MTGTNIYHKIFPFYYLFFAHPGKVGRLLCSYFICVRRDLIYRLLKSIMTPQNHPFPGCDSYIVSTSHVMSDAVYRRTLNVIVRSPSKHCIFPKEILNCHGGNNFVKNITQVTRKYDPIMKQNTFEMLRHLHPVVTEDEAGLFLRYHRDENQLPTFHRILFWPDLNNLISARITFFLSQELFFTKINYEGEVASVPCIFSTLYSSDHPLIIAGRRQPVEFPRPPLAPEVKTESERASENSSIAPPTFTTASNDPDNISIQFGHLDSEV